MQRRGGLGRAELTLQPVPVVVVDQSGGDLPAVHRRDQRFVVRIHLGVGLQIRQPLPFGIGTFELGDSGEHRLEIGLGRGVAEFALPRRAGHVQHAGRQLCLASRGGVEDERRAARRHTHPPALRRVVGRGHRGQRGGVDRGQQVLLPQRLQRR